MQNPQEEIDLWELLKRGIKLFKRRVVIISLFGMGGFFYSIADFFIHPLKYKSFYRKEFLASSPVIRDEVLSDIINRIPEQLAQKNASVSYFPELRKIKAKLEANAKKETRLNLTVETYEKENIRSVLSAIEAYADSIKEVNDMFLSYVAQKTELLNDLRHQASLCDSLKKDPMNCILLAQKKRETEKELKSIKKITFLSLHSDFVFVPNKREGVLSVLGWSFLGLVIGFFAAAAIDFRNKK